MDEDDGVAAEEKMVDGPFHRLLAVLVFVDGHRRRRRRAAAIVRCSDGHLLARSFFVKPRRRPATTAKEAEG